MFERVGWVKINSFFKVGTCIRTSRFLLEMRSGQHLNQSYRVIAHKVYIFIQSHQLFHPRNVPEVFGVFPSFDRNNSSFVGRGNRRRGEAPVPGRATDGEDGACQEEARERGGRGGRGRGPRVAHQRPVQAQHEAVPPRGPPAQEEQQVVRRRGPGGAAQLRRQPQLPLWTRRAPEGAQRPR